MSKLKVMFKVIVNRTTQSRMNDEVIKQHAHYLRKASLRGRGKKHWNCIIKFPIAVVDHTISVELTFRKTGGHKTLEVIHKDQEDIKARLIKAGRNTKFAQYPWKMGGDKPEPIGPVVVTEESEGTQTIGQYETVTRPEDIKIPEVLLSGTDEEIEEYPCFKGIYGRSPHIRTAMAVLHAAFTTKMKRRHNILLWGYPGCAKSHLVNGIKAFLGENAVLELDSTSTTKPGIEKIFLSGLQTGIPPVVIMEEIEKTDESALRVWLSALDERREIRKLNFNIAKVRHIDILCIATANDKVAFDKLFRAGNQSGRGALSSRFTKQIYIPRPNRVIMGRILERDVKEFGGKQEWIEPCLELAEKLDVKDPREVLGMLVGGDRLLDKSYQEDIMAIHKQEQEDYKE